VKLTSDGNFPPLDRNRIFSVALVYCQEEKNNVFDSGGFFKVVQQYLQREFSNRIAEFQGEVMPSQRPPTILIKEVKQNCSGKCHKEST